MSDVVPLGQRLASIRDFVASDWDRHLVELPELVAAFVASSDRLFRPDPVRLLNDGIVVKGVGARPLAERLAPLVPRWVERQLVANPGEPVALVEGTSMVNALQGLGLSDGIETTVRQLRRALEPIDPHATDSLYLPFELALCGLALAVAPVWTRYAGTAYAPDELFEGGRTFGADRPSLVAYLGQASAVGAALKDVLPAWTEFVTQYPMLAAARFATDRSLLLLGRVVFHNVGAQPLDDVAGWVHGELNDAAAAGH